MTFLVSHDGRDVAEIFGMSGAAIVGGRKPRPSIAEILQALAYEFDVPLDVVLAGSRAGDAAEVRYAAAWVAHQHLGMPFGRIAREGLYADHTSVSAAYNRASELMLTPAFRGCVRAALSMLGLHMRG